MSSPPEAWDYRQRSLVIGALEEARATAIEQVEQGASPNDATLVAYSVLVGHLLVLVNCDDLAPTNLLLAALDAADARPRRRPRGLGR